MQLRDALFLIMYVFSHLTVGGFFPESGHAEERVRTNPILNGSPEKWGATAIGQAAGTGYHAGIEREIITEINLVRTNPAAYARQYLAPIRKYYKGRQFAYPGQPVLHTREGLRALDECIRQLQKTRPMQALTPKPGLSRAARDHLEDQARSGATGHVGSDRSSISERINRYGAWDIVVGENLYYGQWPVRRIITALLIDDGLASRGHRKNILNPAFNFIGVAVGPHPLYQKMFVMDFAGAYQ